MKHEIKEFTYEDDRVRVHCTCGWNSALCVNGRAARYAFEDHVGKKS